MYCRFLFAFELTQVFMVSVFFVQIFLFSVLGLMILMIPDGPDRVSVIYLNHIRLCFNQNDCSRITSALESVPGGSNSTSINQSKFRGQTIE